MDVLLILDQTIATLVFATGSVLVKTCSLTNGCRMPDDLLAKLQRLIANQPQLTNTGSTFAVYQPLTHDTLTCELADEYNVILSDFTSDLLNATQSTLKLCHQVQRTTVWPVSTFYPLSKWQYLCKARWYVCEIDCSVFSEIESLCEARQTPLGQIRPSVRHRSLVILTKACLTIRVRISSVYPTATENTKLGDIKQFSYGQDRIALCVCVSGQRKGKKEKLVFLVESGSNSK